jgi:hypothetical protein
MTISDKEFFMALLSMDSYNRGYGSGINLEALGISSAIGTAAKMDIDLPAGSVTAGFYAAAYETEYGTVISYRGTNFSGGAAYPNIVNGWAFAAGDFAADQIELSTKFLEAVAVSNISGNVILTGHSLCGGLAGSPANDNCQRERVAA